jgi:hypothetical protein
MTTTRTLRLRPNPSMRHHTSTPLLNLCLSHHTVTPLLNPSMNHQTGIPRSRLMRLHYTSTKAIELSIDCETSRVFLNSYVTK